MRKHHAMPTMFPDHDWHDTDFESLELKAEEGRIITKEEADTQKFEREYGKFLRHPDVKKMDDVTALQTFLRLRPHWKITTPATAFNASRSGGENG